MMKGKGKEKIGNVVEKYMSKRTRSGRKSMRSPSTQWRSAMWFALIRWAKTVSSLMKRSVSP